MLRAVLMRRAEEREGRGTSPRRHLSSLNPIRFFSRRWGSIDKVQPDESAGLDSCFRCPITGDIMIDPVIDTEGFSYERSAIKTWLHRSKTSPMTREYLSYDMLTTNRALKEAIASWCALEARLRQRELECLSKVAEQARVLRVRLLEIEGSFLRAHFGDFVGELNTWKEVNSSRS